MAVVAVGIAAGLLLAMALAVTGPVLLVVPVLVVIASLVVQRPGVALGALLVTAMGFEGDPEGILPFTRVFQERLPLARLSPVDLLLLVLLAATALDLGRHRRSWRLPGPFTAPTALLLVAIAWGAVMGRFAGGDAVDAANSVISLIYLALLPTLVVNVVDGRKGLRIMAAGAGAMAAYKGVEGTAGWLLGAGRKVGETTLTYYEPAPNWLLLLFLLALLATWFLGERLPRWARWAAPLSLAAFVLSFRRSFWIAGVLGVILVLLVASGRRRPFMVLGAVAASIAAWATLTAGGATESNNVLAQRARSFRPSEIQTTSEDRYRLDEQRNVFREIQLHPITGLGLGVPWTAHHPLSEEHPGDRNYTHVVLFWFWTKLGLPGAVAYVWLMVAALRSSWGVWRCNDDRVLRATGLALFAGLSGLIVAETTGSFTGVSSRFSVAVGAVLGWLAVAVANPAAKAPRSRVKVQSVEMS